ncbi:MAG: class I SAM-dependent methyltransferase [Rhodanobacteraceae bacterium]
MPQSSRYDADPALETLLWPFACGALRWPADGRVLFLRARCNALLREAASASWVFAQSFKPHADALTRAGFSVTDSTIDGHFPLVLSLPPRQRDESRAAMAAALRAAPHGVVVASMANSEGARTAEADFMRLAGSVQSLSKNKCRVFWSLPDAAATDRSLIDEWAALDAPRPIEDGRFVSRPGLFAWDHVDPGSRLLADHLPTTLAGRGADIGSGFGYLSVEVLARCPRVAALDLYEAEARALELARVNLARADPVRTGADRANSVSGSARATLDFLWHDVTAGLPRRYDFIVCNPPFHQGRADNPALGRAFVEAAHAALLPGGSLWLVANRHLPYEDVLESRFRQWRNVAELDGFKIIQATA